MDLCLLLKTYFEQKRYKVAIANTLSTGLQELSTFLPDIIFLDNNLPDGSGWDKSEWILENQPQANVFLISAYRSSPANKTPNARLRVIEKPLSMRVIDSLVSND